MLCSPRPVSPFLVLPLFRIAIQNFSDAPVVQRIKQSHPGAVSKPALIAIVVSGSLVILLLLVIIAVLYRRKKLYGGFYILTLPPMPDYIKKLDPSRTLQEQTHKLPLCADWEFPRNRLNLGEGLFYWSLKLFSAKT